MTLEEALNRAAAELPDGTTISVVVERDAGNVECSDKEGNIVSLDRPDDTMAEQVIEHLKWLLEEQAADEADAA